MRCIHWQSDIEIKTDDIELYRLQPIIFVSKFQAQKNRFNERPIVYFDLAGAEGLEPPTIGFGDRCSTNWNYAPASKSGNYTVPLIKVKSNFELI